MALRILMDPLVHSAQDWLGNVTAGGEDVPPRRQKRPRLTTRNESFNAPFAQTHSNRSKLPFIHRAGLA